MRKQIAAANWKMNLTLQQGEQLLNDIISKPHSLTADQQVVFAVPFPYLSMATAKLTGKTNVFVAAQNCSNKKTVLILVKCQWRFCNPWVFSGWFWGTQNAENILMKAISCWQRN
jgi:hypothetical protein